VLDRLGPAEAHLVEEAQRAHRLIEGAPGHLPGDQVLLVRAQVLGAEQIGRAAEVLGELGDAQDVGLDGARRLVAQTEVVDVALT
jgi:hypothetical protein